MNPSITISFLSFQGHIWHGVCVRFRLMFARRLCKGVLLLVVGDDDLLSFSGHRFEQFSSCVSSSGFPWFEPMLARRLTARTPQ